MHTPIANVTLDFQCGDVLNTDSEMMLFAVLLRTGCLSAHGAFLQGCRYKSVFRFIEHMNGHSDFGFPHSNFFELFSGQGK